MIRGLIPLNSQDSCKKSVRPSKGPSTTGFGSSPKSDDRVPIGARGCDLPGCAVPSWPFLQQVGQVSLGHCAHHCWQGSLGVLFSPQLFPLPAEQRSDVLKNGLEALPGLEGLVIHPCCIFRAL